MAETPDGGRGGTNILLLLILLVLIGGALFWAWRASPPATPAPSSTGAPPSIPSGGGS
jgi:hypothetical protein